jgi:hypothetical protein
MNAGGLTGRERGRRVKVIALGGVPGSGKSAVMRLAMKKLSGIWLRAKEGVMVWEDGGNYAVLGAYDAGNKFPGTDRLSMSVQPAAEDWFVANAGSYEAVLFEGDRLFNKSFLTALAEMPKVELQVLALTASPAALKARHAGRADTQNATWLKGRATKNAAVLTAFRKYLTLLTNEAAGDAEKCAAAVVELARCGA